MVKHWIPLGREGELLTQSNSRDRCSPVFRCRRSIGAFTDGTPIILCPVLSIQAANRRPDSAPLDRFSRLLGNLATQSLYATGHLGCLQPQAPGALTSADRVEQPVEELFDQPEVLALAKALVGLDQAERAPRLGAIRRYAAPRFCWHRVDTAAECKKDSPAGVSQATELFGRFDFGDAMAMVGDVWTNRFSTDRSLLSDSD